MVRDFISRLLQRCRGEAGKLCCDVDHGEIERVIVKDRCPAARCEPSIVNAK